MPSQSNTSRAVLDFQNKTAQIVNDFREKMFEIVKKQVLADSLSRAKEVGIISHPSQEYKEDFEEYLDKVLRNEELKKKIPKIMKEFREIFENDEEAAFSFCEKEFEKHGVNLPIPGEQDGCNPDPELFKQFLSYYF